MYRSGNGRSPHNTNFEFQYMSKTVEKGRSAKTGQFVPIEYAQKHPDTTVVEKVKVGPTGKSSVSCPLKPSDSAPLKHSTMPP